MTEHEWQAADDPRPMLTFLKGRTSVRKLRLLACACCRRVWPLLTDERSRHAVEVAEQAADGRAGPDELAAAYRRAQRVVAALRRDQPERGDCLLAARAAARAAALQAVAESVAEAALAVEAAAAQTVRHDWLPGVFQGVFGAKGQIFAAWTAELEHQCALVREIFGNPFRLPMVPEIAGQVAVLFQVVYEQRAFDRLPILADALEEAGCRDATLLDHCRRPGIHVPGCWAVDLVLGKE
jgi:hypothetical protein